LFPPCLPLILYAVVATNTQLVSLSLKDVFLGGAIPGTLLVLMTIVLGMFYTEYDGSKAENLVKHIVGILLKLSFRLSWISSLLIFVAFVWLRVFYVHANEIVPWHFLLIAVIQVSILSFVHWKLARDIFDAWILSIAKMTLLFSGAASVFLLVVSAFSFLSEGQKEIDQLLRSLIGALGSVWLMKRFFGELLRALWNALGELLLPIVALTALFSGYATPIEAASVSAFYAFLLYLVDGLWVRKVKVIAELPKMVSECGLLVGGVLLILGVAMGLTDYLIFAMIPDQMVEWAQATIESKYVFLLALNGALILVGCLMDIFSAIIVIVPLIVPLGVVFGIHPVHLGIIFLANLQLGYLTPPIGMNLFLASYRFGKPMSEVIRASFPLLIVFAIGVLLITYVPFLTTWLPNLLQQ